MAKSKTITGQYFYIDLKGNVVQASNPGRDRKTGLLKSPLGIDEVQCWSDEVNEGWTYPDGKTRKAGDKSSLESLKFEEDEEFLKRTRSKFYCITINNIKKTVPNCYAPFWHYCIQEEWGTIWKEEWAGMVLEDEFRNPSVEWWKIEVRNFITFIKKKSEQGAYLRPITMETITYIKKYFGKKEKTDDSRVATTTK